MTHRKILHAADIHLDSPLQRLGTYEHAPVDRIRSASRQALENMVTLAIEQTVDLVVIAGDLYDGDWPDQNTGLFFVAQASKLIRAGIPVVVIRGNHDAANRMTSALPLPKNPDGSEVMMSANQVDSRLFDSLGIAVHGRSFRTRSETENLAVDYPPPIGGLCNVGLLHTSLTGAEGHDHYSPCTPAQLTEKQYDYWALGHIHTRADHRIEGGPPIVFSGNVQGRHIRESGPKGCVLIEVDHRNQCEHSFCELDVVRWQLCSVDTTSMSNTDEVIDAFQAWLDQAIAVADGRLLVTRVELTGTTKLHSQLLRQSAQLTASLQATAVTHGCDQVWLENLKVRTVPESVARGIQLDGPMESLAAITQQLREDDAARDQIRKELSGLVKKLPVELSGTNQPLRVDDPRWIDQLIDAASADVTAQLQPEGTAK